MSIATGNPGDEGVPFPVVVVPNEARSLEAVVHHLLAHHPGVPAQELEAALSLCMHRESLGSTKVGRNVAIPQVVAPWVVQSGIIAGRLAAPLSWLDGKPVQQVFLVAKPDHTSILPYLERIPRFLQSRGEPENA